MKIGDLRRSLFVNYDCKWNGLVRDVTASNEKHDEEVNEHIVHRALLETIRENAMLDHQFPERSRIGELFAESA
jgi:hypothetical protein